ncbi:phospholipase D-like domain-containing protein [Methylosinus sporium]|uniref:phospholipase D-like domain-containing protein n=1 Tax=Methylosinus sporium TaxID=428 RepID=UPI00383B29F9
MKALAFSNNDIAVVAWTFDHKLDGCLGFAVYRVDVHANSKAPLPAMARFEKAPVVEHQTTEQAPVQKFWWKDLGAERGVLYRYEIVALGGAPGHLTPLAGVDPLVTNAIVLTPERGSFEVYFNRGIVATQAVTKALGTPSVDRLMRHLADPNDSLRRTLAGQLPEGLVSLLDRADRDGGEIRGALYELSDPKGLEARLGAVDHGDPAKRAIILGNERETVGKGAAKEVNEDKDAADRAALKKAGVPVIDRILPDQHIPHNKFLLLKEGGHPAAVLTGSTNWTMNALAAQTNNALIVENADVAALYQAYWDQLEKDTGDAARSGKFQSPAFRGFVRAQNEQAMTAPVVLDGGAKAHVLFSPSTKTLWSAHSHEKADDMEFVFDLMRKAKHAILFLAFDPGNVSILDVAGEALRADPKLFVRGALTSPQRASNFAAALKGERDADAPDGEVAVIGEKTGHGAQKDPIDYRAIPAGHVGADDAFGQWEAELAKAGHAIIHDKIVVIDPFDDDCVVVTGSHNLGNRASHNNDENFLVVQGHRGLAEAYACHVLDIYDHYAWRYWLHREKDKFGRPLDPTPDWQDRYFVNGEPTSPELRFWLSATASVAPATQAGRARTIAGATTTRRRR